MPKRGQKHYDHPGHTNPSKSEPVTTGTPKKQETFKEQAAQHEDPGKRPPAAKVPHDHPHEGHTLEAVSNLEAQRGESRSGSESNAHNASKAKHHSHGTILPAEPQGSAPAIPDAEFDHDLHPEFLAGEDHGLQGPHPEKDASTAADIKDLVRGLVDFTMDELRQIVVLPAGSRLEQGATYLDLARPEPGAFTAMAGMEATAGSYIVPKTEVDYVLWNKLLGVTNPARLDQEG